MLIVREKEKKSNILCSSLHHFFIIAFVESWGNKSQAIDTNSYKAFHDAEDEEDPISEEEIEFDEMKIEGEVDEDEENFGDYVEMEKLKDELIVSDKMISNASRLAARWRKMKNRGEQLLSDISSQQNLSFSY